MDIEDFPTNEWASGFDWSEAFAVSNTATATPHSTVVDAVKPDDVAGIVEWFADSPEGWASTEIRALLRLHDGRYAYLAAGCDTTGWDCQASGSIRVGSRDDVLRFGLGDEDRARWDLTV